MKSATGEPHIFQSASQRFPTLIESLVVLSIPIDRFTNIWENDLDRFLSSNKARVTLKSYEQ